METVSLNVSDLNINPKEDLPYLLAMLRLPRVGPIRFIEYLNKFKNSVQELFDAHGNFKPLHHKADWEAVEKDLAFASQSNTAILTLWDPDYPPLLKEIYACPPILFVRGKTSLLREPQIALVGSRNPSPFGLNNAELFSKILSEAGFCITSGLALGVDRLAHRAALPRTIAVVANGLDNIYPASNEALARDIADQGAIVSEFPIGMPPMTQNFPRRNRIISGLSIGTLVIEAALKSGSLITAKYALEQGREVFAIPGSIHNPVARGCHTLLRQGAKLVERAEDVIEELGSFLGCVTKQTKPISQSRSSSHLKFQLGFQYDTLLNLLSEDSMSIDLLAEKSGLTSREVSSMLLELEMKGLVTAVNGGFIRTPG